MMTDEKKQEIHYESGAHWLYKETQGEVNNEPSLTVPDQTMSIREILERYARGLSVTDGRVPIYLGEDEMPDLSKLDLVELHEMKFQVAQNIEALEKPQPDPVPEAPPTE